MSSAGDAVLARLDGAAEEAARELSALVCINTVNPYAAGGGPGERAGQEHLAGLLEKIGGRISFLEVPGDIYAWAGVLGPPDRDWTGRPNLLAEFTFGAGRGASVLLDGHMDTVGVAGYEGDPFGGEIDGDLVRGRGASDCKGGLTAALIALRALRETAPGALDGRVTLASVVDEECSGGGAGTLACCRAGVPADHAILVDGAANSISLGCQGVFTGRVEVRGAGGHAAGGGERGGPLEAILAAKRAVDRFAALRAERVPTSAINVGLLTAGTAPWNAPAAGALEFNGTYLPEEEGAEVRALFERMLAEAVETEPALHAHPPRLTWLKDIYGYRLKGRPAVLDAAERAFARVHGEVRTLEKRAWDDAAHLSRKLGAPVMGLGGGGGGGIHGPSEYNEVSAVVGAAKTIALTVAELLGA